MKINCGPSPATKERLRIERHRTWFEELQEWHSHFCLWPVRLGDNDCRWLERIERRLHPEYSFGMFEFWLAFHIHRPVYQYRATAGKPADEVKP